MAASSCYLAPGSRSGRHPLPANGIWVRYAMDVVYSSNPNVGSMKLYADTNGDGDFTDAGEQSP